MEPLNQEDKQRMILQHRTRLRQVKPPPQSRAMMWWMTIALGAALLATILIFPHYCIRLIASGSTAITWTGSRDRATVALTVDDGPDPVYTPQILKVLAAEHVKATFFVVGNRVVKYPEIVDEICAAGHEIGNHTGSWRRTLFLDAREFAKDLDAAAAELSRLPCAKKFFRPAGIWIRPAQLRIVHQRGNRCVLGSAYAFD